MSTFNNSLNNTANNDFTISRVVSDGGPQFIVTNGGVSATSSARHVIATASGTGDLYTLYDSPSGSSASFEVGFRAATISWVIQNDPTKASSNMDGTNVLEVQNTGSITFGNRGSTGNFYTFPLTDGTSGQQLTTNGSGVVTWESGSGSGILSLVPDTGTDPVVPDGTGKIKIFGQNPANANGIRVTGGTNELDIAMFSPFVGNFSFNSVTSGATESLTVTNTSNTANSQAQISTTVAGATAGDAWNQWNVGTASGYSLGIDNSDSDILKLTYAASGSINPSSGATFLQADTDGNIEVPTRDFFVGNNRTGECVQSIVGNVATSGDSSARFVVGTSSNTGDAYILFDVGEGSDQAFEVGVNSDQANHLQIQITPGNAPPLLMDGVVAWDMTPGSIGPGSDAGCISTPLQPAFLVQLTTSATNVTGNGTTYSFGTSGGGATTTEFDQGTHITSPGGVVTFTAPIDGKYQFNASITMSSLVLTMTSVNLILVTTTRNYFGQSFNIGAVKDSTDKASVSLSAMTQMSTGDTAILHVIIAGGPGDTAGVTGGTDAVSYFSGTLFC